MSTITYCRQCSGDLEPGAYDVTNAITSTTTPEEFDAIINQYGFGLEDGYKLENGGRCAWNALGVAAHEGGNPELIRHIVQIGGIHLLNLGNRFGWTPLFCAAECEDPEGGFLAAKELIRLGADLNLATSMWCGDTSEGDTPEGATPLWMAAEKTQNLKLVKLLLKRGSIIPENLSARGREVIVRAQEEMIGHQLALRVLGRRLPNDLVRNIDEMISPDDK